MPSATDFPAKGRIKKVDGDTIIFVPAGTSYELKLKTNTPVLGEIDRPVEVIVRVRARKVWTVPSGGNFIAPIFGPPKIIQGRVKWLDEKTLVVHAGCPIVVDMPAAESAVDLPNGSIQSGEMVNVTALPGATVEILVSAAI